MRTTGRPAPAVSSARGPAVITARGYGWRHAGRKAPALTDIDLAVPAGQRVLLVGASGSGKSTLLHALTGVLPADSGHRTGELLVDGRRPDPARGRSGLVLQAIYAAGKDPQPISVIKHAEPTYRTSRQLYAHTGIRSVPRSERRRGDLIFYTNSSGVVHHVAIDLGDGTMMEAYGRYAAIRKISARYGSSYIAPYVKRVFT